MQKKRPLLIIIPAVVLVLCVVGTFLTRGAMANLQFLRSSNGSGSRGDVVDQRPLQTAQALSPLAISAEEQAFAHEALRVADHEVDQAFAMALRQANSESRTLTGKALAVSQQVTTLQASVKQDQAAVDALVASAKTRNPGPDDDDLDVAKAQLALDTDELSDAQAQLAIVSGDQRGKIQEELATHEAGMKRYEGQQTDGQVAVLSARRYQTLAGRLKGYFDQLSREGLLKQAKTQADANMGTLSAQAAALQQKAAALTGAETAGGAANTAGAGNVSAPSNAAGAAGASAPAAAARPSRLVLLRRLETQRSILGILNERVEGQKELSTVYAKWLAQVQLQHRIVIHLILQSLAWVALIVLCAALMASLVRMLMERRMVGRSASELRSMKTMLTILQLTVQIVALLLILLVIFGPPSQVPTILGLATAGLTVVFQDHILAFFGWFVLMGRNGIRVGDWVEISGVGGEVVEVGLFRTTLIEMGNWTEKGHPTGRRISFVNKFAMSGQFFNFSTNGQWMWDELTVNVPAVAESFALVEHIRQRLVQETAQDTALAEDEWQRSKQQNVFTQFSATPSVEMRPAAAGIDLVIRYVTRAGDRVEMRNRLSQAVIQLMSGGAAVAEPPALAAAAGK